MISENFPVAAIFLYSIPVIYWLIDGYLDWQRKESKARAKRRQSGPSN